MIGEVTTITIYYTMIQGWNGSYGRGLRVGSEEATVRRVFRPHGAGEMTPENQLTRLGWNSSWMEEMERLGEPALVPARVVGERKGSYRLWDAGGELTAVLSGRMRHRQLGNEHPTVGDWVAITPGDGASDAVIRVVLPRSSKFSRQVSGGRARRSGGQTAEQVVAANLDTVFIVSGLDGGRNLSPKRIERYLSLAWNSGVSPVVVLNKMDVCDDVPAAIATVEAVAFGVPIHAVSATGRLGLDALSPYLASGQTAAFLGSSGVGKSSLINALLGTEAIKVGAVRDDDLRGRHTTTGRELLLIPGGAAVIDTPGMRELQMWADEGGLDNAFRDVEVLADTCRFVDCQHRTEPGCAVTAAIASGELHERRLTDYHRLQMELDHLTVRQEGRARLEAKAKGKQVSRVQK